MELEGLFELDLRRETEKSGSTGQTQQEVTVG